MAIRAILRRANTACRVRKVRVKSLAAVAFGTHRLLLRIDPVAVLVLRTDNNRTRRPDDGEPVLFNGAVDAKHEYIVAHDLRIVSRKIAVNDSFELIQRHPLIRLHREMTAKTARRP